MASNAQQLVTDDGVFSLDRYPATSDRSLRAWDAADEYLLEHVAGTDQKFDRVLLVNDTFGALSCALNQYNLHHWTDSLLSQYAVTANFKRNALSPAPVFLKSTESPLGVFDLVLIKVPKTTALLEDQLQRLRPVLHSDTVVVAAGMVRNLSPSSFQSFENVLGPVTTSLARKKARLIFATLDSSLVPPLSPYPTVFTDPALGYPLYGYANVFSRQRLDAGARYLLDHLNQIPEARRVVDLGCGNGVLGIAYQCAYLEAELCFIDESFMAVASARDGYARRFQDAECDVRTRFLVNDGLAGFADSSVDLILCNPPFHQQHAIAENTAHELFVQSRGALRKNGELWVVANRHLKYQVTLNRLFGSCSVIARGPRFNIYRSVRR